MKYITDYGVLMEIFINTIVKDNSELSHKSFIKKITNRLDRYHKRRRPMCADSERRAITALRAVENDTASDEMEISLGVLCWTLYNKHSEELKPYNFDRKSFEDMNRYFGAQGIAMQTLRILTKIEEAMVDD